MFSIISIDQPIKKPAAVNEFNLDLPPNKSIGTFDEYVNNYPYKKSTITSHRHSLSKGLLVSDSISLLIEKQLYTNEIKSKINDYIKDLETKGFTVLNVDTLSGGNPTEVKNWVIDQYDHDVSGVLFIGDIPAAWVEVSESTFPSDLFYMDVDGNWEDNNNDDIYESHSAGTGDMGPELYVARLFASSLQYNDEQTMISDYFEKIYQYNLGSLSVPWNGLEYIEEDWYTMDVNLNEIFDEDISRYDFGYQTTASHYLNILEEGHHFVTVCAHSYPGGHHFSRRPTEAVTYAHIYVYSQYQRDAMLLLGSDDGIITWLNAEKILEKDVYTSWIADQYQIHVTLKEGWNRLLCKVSQDGGDYQLSARFVDEQMSELTNLKYQLNNPELSGIEGEFIRGWLVNGFHQDSQDSFYEYLDTNYLDTSEGNIIPSEGELMGGNTWEMISSSVPYIDLDNYGNEVDFGVNYCYSRIHAEEDITCELWTGYDDGMKAWLNGEEIICDNRYGSYNSDMSKIPVELESGDNHLVLKISEWMGTHGFSARFCTSTGEKINGLSFNPEPEPISYIGKWLLIEPFHHQDDALRLTTAYIPNEYDISPSIGEEIEGKRWQQAIGGGRPFDIAEFFNKGDWVFSEDIQSADPPAFFYNLFACSAGRFPDENYLAGSYIFNTTYGLVSIASSKSGSMLNFQDFTQPLSEGKCIGDAFVDWFDSQAPFIQWEKEWFYGMMIFGDPTLNVNPTIEPSVNIDIVSPEKGIYFGNQQIFPFVTPIVFGDATVKVSVNNKNQEIHNVLFYVNDELWFTDDTAPFETVVDKKAFGKQKINVVANYNIDESVSDQLYIWKFL
ncbi:MAG: hypothetical protein KGY65_02425 [Candidatus Thermoplasmatota archaeon]|nr:hypothetical protein [Candidatus Thermoplasmatota archaeon]